MTNKDSWQELYSGGLVSWDIGKHDYNLENVVVDTPIDSCKTLEIGCGTGDNALWLAERGFQVTGVDLVDSAIQKAKEKSAESDVSCTFLTADFMDEKLDGAPFDFIFDRGCFHSFDSLEERSRFALNAAVHLATGGLWLTIMGSADDPPRDTGPPRRSAHDIMIAVEPNFEILSLYTSYFETNRPKPARAWVCLMRKRD
ncbi:class I SAM-dependent methyltransferase [Candidatus Latescibacterota bacterium]